MHRVQERLKQELEHKLSTFTLSERIDRRLYFRFTEPLLRCSEWIFANAESNGDRHRRGQLLRDRRSIVEIERVLNKRITWEDFSLTFRMRLSREPDIYQTLIQGFLIMEPEDLNHFCARILRLNRKGNELLSKPVDAATRLIVFARIRAAT